MEKTFQNIPFLRITIALVIGIIAGTYSTFNVKLCLAILSIVLVIHIVLNTNYKFTFSRFFGAGISFFFLLVGIVVTQQFNQKPFLIEKGTFAATILETPLEKPNSWKTMVKMEAVFNADSILQTNETVIVYFEKSDSVFDLQAGDVIVFDKTPQQISNKNNPFEFDYKKYLEQKRIYRQVYLSSENWKKTKKTNLTLVCRAEIIRESLLQIYRSQPIDETEFEILSALTLGYKRELDPETKRIFSASGASHVLAVSGLHVGIVFWLISLLFGFMQKQKTGRVLFMIISISTLWFYAFITGLSPSVMRASAMFSIFVIGENLNRKSNIYNSLSASAFILLLINPINLFDIGFQLSYAAVFGIVYLQPKLEKIIYVKNKFIKFFWSLITVSVAAQISTFPLTTYYFGQFPTYFWITNTFVIPAVMILIPLGIILLFVSKIHIISNLLAVVLNFIIKITYFLLSFIDQLPFAVSEISINHVQLIFITAIVISVFIFLKNHKIYYLKAVLLFILFLSISTFFININRLNRTELVIYNTPENPAIHFIRGKKNYILSEEKIKKEELYYFPGTSTCRKLGLNQPVYLTYSDTLANESLQLKNGLAIFEGKTISLIKNISIPDKNNLPDFIINPANLNFKPDEIEPGTMIITNKRYLSEIMLNSPRIHNTAMKGAFRKKW